MQSISDPSFEELVECSICLETYTRPKVLPCQHTYCYGCLLTLCEDKSNVTCPQCREVHDIPQAGVDSFKNNLFVNNLLSTLMAKKQCCDCHKAVAVTLCDHCDSQLCGQCLVQHTKLSFEISSFLTDLKDDLLDKESRCQSKGELVDDLTKDIARMKEIFDQAIQKLIERRNLFENFMGGIGRVYQDMGQLAGVSYVDELSAKFVKCKTTNSLQDFKNNLVDMRTVTRLIQRQPDQFKFAGDTKALQSLESYGHVEFGQSVIDIKGTHRFEPSAAHKRDQIGGKNSTVVKTTKGVETLTDIQAEDESVISRVNTSMTATSNIPTSATWPAMESSPRDTTIRDADREPQTANVACSAAAELFRDLTLSRFRQNQLPTDVNYTAKVNCPKTIIGHRGGGLSGPHNCSYHVTRDEIYVADYSNDRIMVYDSQGRDGRSFYSLVKPIDVAISDSGEFIYLLKHSELTIVSVNGNLVRKIEWFPLGTFKKCVSVYVHKKYVAVLDSDSECVIVYSERGDYVRHFRSTYLEDARSIAIAANGNVYVTYCVFSRVNVMEWDGKFVRTFGQQDFHDDVDGVSVDADGYVCVSRPLSHRVDVYDPAGRHVSSLGRPGGGPGCLNRPFGLCLIPDGRLVIVDSSNHRLQIL